MTDFLVGVVENGTWYPGIGDPTFVGWLTVIAYIFTSIFCLFCGLAGNTLNQQKQQLSNRDIQNTRRRGYQKRRSKTLNIDWLWILIAIFMLLLGINKQLDLQSWLTVIGKNMAQSQGWYESRREVQFLFIITILIVAIAFLAFVTKNMNKNQVSNWLGLSGLGLLSCFIVIRASSFHHIDRLIGFQTLGLRMNWLLELGGISVIAIASLINLRAKYKLRYRR